MLVPVAEPTIVAAAAKTPELNVKPPKVMPLAFNDVNAVSAAVKFNPALPATVILVAELPKSVTVSRKVPVGVS